MVKSEKVTKTKTTKEAKTKVAAKTAAAVKPKVAAKAKAAVETKVVPEVKKTAKAKKTTTPAVAIGTINVTGKAAELIKKYQRNNEDTGSTEVQIALFTAKIDQLSKHLRKHTKDSDSKRGILIMVGKRRRLLTFLQKTDLKSYESLIADLGLRK